MSRTMCPSCRSIMPRAWVTVAGVACREPHHLEAVAERGERVPQLVGQQREEFVLAPVLLPQTSSIRPPFRDVDAGGGHEQDATRLVRHGGEDEVHHPLGAVGHEVVGLRTEHASRRPPGGRPPGPCPSGLPSGSTTRTPRTACR